MVSSLEQNTFIVMSYYRNGTLQNGDKRRDVISLPKNCWGLERWRYPTRPLGGPAAVEAVADSAGDEKKKARKSGNSTDPLERVRQKKEENAIKVTYDGKTVTYSVGVRSGNSDRVGVPKGTLSSTKRRTTQLKGTKRPTPSIIDENRRSRPSPGVSGDEESSVKEGEKKNVQGREGEGNLWSWCLKKRERAKVRDLTNPTVCSYRPAEIVRIRARFELPLQLGPNEKKTKKNRQGKPKEKAR
ncbi:hypothetical protein GEV33_006698 [Tenebrio molitor]|uniref:Uncharacterized protein n=1 Tax=Tenebrio molitor TaxID=7067 RepID=A0A8J6HM62_TENMO|nr:hypothetical protein GEV33_006698 [Tenebrio molitor]